MDQTQTIPTHEDALGEPKAVVDVFARIGEAAWRAESTRDMRHACCEAVSAHLGAALTVLQVDSGANASRIAVGEADAVERWGRVLDADLLKADARGAAVGHVFGRPDGTRVALIAATPVAGVDGGGVLGAVIPCEDAAGARGRIAELQSIAAHIANAHEIFRLRPRLSSRIDGAGALMARAASSRSLSAFVYDVANGIRSHLECEQVALGMVVRDRVRVACVSGLDEAKRNSPGTLLIRQAMEECYDRGEEIACGLDHEPGDPSAIQAGHRLHERWRSAANSGAVASFPLMAAEETVGVLSVRLPAERTLSRHEIELVRATVSPIGPSLALLERATRGPIQRVHADAARGGRWLMAPGSHGSKLLLVMAVMLAFWFLFGTMRYRVGVEGVVSSEDLRVVSAPMEGRLLACRVEAGDHVEAGDVLAEFDTRDLELERHQLESERRVLEVELATATRGGDLAAASLAAARNDLIGARLESVERRLARTLVRAPVSGLVLRGDLSERVGEALPLGEALFDLAPSGSLGVRLRVPQHAVDELAPGLEAVFVTHAEPERPLRCVLESIPPGTEVGDGRSVFVVEARLEDASSVRVGLEGIGRIDAGPRPVWWVALHRVIDAVRMEL